MTASYLFHADGLSALSRYVAPDSLFAFDLDGTLVPIVENYSAVPIAVPVRATLERLAGLANIAVITGRSRKDARGILGFDPQLIVGNHGAEWPPEDAGRNWGQVKCCLRWQERLYALVGFIPGVEIEFKGESLAIHYRKTAQPDEALARINAAVATLDPQPRSIGGKFVLNLLAAAARDKGDALVAAMQRFGSRRAIYFGDDITDEEVFRLTGVDLFGVHVGSGNRTAAPYYLTGQSELLGLLNSMVGMLEAVQGVNPLFVT